MSASQKAKEAAKASAAAFAAAAGPWADRAGLLEAEELVQACTPGVDLLVMRAPLRTAALFAEELRAAARHAQLPDSLLLPLGSGMWVLRHPGAARGDGRAADARAALVATLPILAGVRLHLRIEASAACGSSLLEAVRASPPARSHAHWSLHYEQHFPSGDHAQLPFVAVCSAPSLAIGLHGALGGGYCSALASHGAVEGASPVDEFVLLETKHAVLLCRQLPLPRPPPHEGGAGGPAPPLPLNGVTGATSTLDADEHATSDAAVIAGQKRQRDRARGMDGTCSSDDIARTSAGEAAGETAGEAVDVDDPNRASDGGGGGKSALPWWIGAWERRGFDFSASLDPLVAIAAINLAAFAHVAAERPDEATRSPDSSLRSLRSLRSLAVYDPCCGSGTVLAAGAALGHRVRGSDLRAEFIRRAASNLSGAGIAAPDAMDVLDATEMVPPPPGAPPPAELVVSNPPWGKNFGAAEDGAKIVDAVLRAHIGPARTTLCLLVNATALAAAVATPGVALRAHVRLGGVEVVLLQTAPDGSAPLPTS